VSVCFAVNPGGNSLGGGEGGRKSRLGVFFALSVCVCSGGCISSNDVVTLSCGTIIIGYWCCSPERGRLRDCLIYPLAATIWSPRIVADSTPTNKKRNWGMRHSLSPPPTPNPDPPHLPHFVHRPKCVCSASFYPTPSSDCAGMSANVPLTRQETSQILPPTAINGESKALSAAYGPPTSGTSTIRPMDGKACFVYVLGRYPR
jgi:hypothetical protein